jgi:hypothetical protein
MGVFTRAKPFTHDNISAAPNAPGVYIIYHRRKPFYVGRSKTSIRDRLNKHFRFRGSRNVREKPNHELSFEAEALSNPVQAESFLIAALGVRERVNLRWEFYGPDWEL